MITAPCSDVLPIDHGRFWPTHWWRAGVRRRIVTYWPTRRWL